MDNGYPSPYSGIEPTLPEDYEKYVNLLAIDLIWQKQGEIAAPAFLSPIILVLLKLRVLEQMHGQKIIIQEQCHPDDQWLTTYVFKIEEEEAEEG